MCLSIGHRCLTVHAQFGGVGAIPLGEKLLGEYMRDAGYATHVSPVLSVNAAYGSWLLVHAIDVELGCAVVLTRSVAFPGTRTRYSTLANGCAPKRAHLAVNSTQLQLRLLAYHESDNAVVLAPLAAWWHDQTAILSNEPRL